VKDNYILNISSEIAFYSLIILYYFYAPYSLIPSFISGYDTGRYNAYYKYYSEFKLDAEIESYKHIYNQYLHNKRLNKKELK
jgi:hypothetical protein